MNKCKIFAFLISIFFSATVLAQDYSQVCKVPIAFAPLTSWDFNNGDSPDRTDAYIDWTGDHGGIVNIPETNLRGLRFNYRGKDPKGDSSSEFRYIIKEPQSHVFEKFSVYQPINFYHRLNIRVTPGEGYNPEQWQKGQAVVTPRKGDTARVALAEDNYLWLEAPSAIYAINWGQGIEIQNSVSGASFISAGSKFMASNNKLSAMWQGKYSNAALIVGTTARPENKGGKEGIGYCELLGSKTADYKAFQVKRNDVGRNHVPCFDPIDNGSIVDFIIERKRSSSPDIANGVYAIWKRTNSSGWQLLFRNESVPAYQPANNYFDKGYFLGWSNSGYSEDTNFYLLNWSIWDRQPHFLPYQISSQ